jgi:3-dehydroquinate synthetase
MDHLADIKKFARKPVHEAAAAGLIKSYALVMSKADTRYVACSDPTELERVRENFVKKKLGLPGTDADESIKAICEHMKSDKTKARTTFYYLLAEHYGKLEIFVKK